MKPTNVRLSALLAALVLLAFHTAPVAAQQAETAESDSVPRFNIDGVIVNIVKTPVRVGVSPYPISVVGAAELREGKSGMFLEDALETLPGVQVQNRFNYAVGERVSIRGFGSRAQFGVRGIHVEVDGIPATLPDGQSTLDHVDIGSLGRVEALRNSLRALLVKLKSEGATIAAYGAAAKGATLINYVGIGTDLVDFVVDRNTHKHGRYMPGQHIPIRPPEHLLEAQPDYTLMLSWNYKDEILEQQREYRNRGGRFIIPVPEPAIV